MESGLLRVYTELCSLQYYISHLSHILYIKPNIYMFPLTT